MIPTMINLKRRYLLASSLLLLLPKVWAASESDEPVIDVWKSPACGCCKDWISYLQKNDFFVRVHDTGNAAARRRLGIPEAYASCHTATVDGYVLEGHVSVREIRRLLAERPDALGLAVPKMPIGSPGMDGPVYEGEREPYDVLLLAKDGSSRVFQSYR